MVDFGKISISELIYTRRLPMSSHFLGLSDGQKTGLHFHPSEGWGPVPAIKVCLDIGNISSVAKPRRSITTISHLRCNTINWLCNKSILLKFAKAAEWKQGVNSWWSIPGNAPGVRNV
jgi:hypothetical protein